MAATFLLISDALESDRLGRTLQRIWGRDLRLVSDLGVSSPEEQLMAVRPDVLILGTGKLSVSVTGYVAAARRLCRGCVIVLLCDPAFAAQAARLDPDLLLQRPLTGAFIQGALAELAKTLRERPSQPTPPTLDRLDELFADPLLPARPRATPRRARSAS